MPLKVYNYLSRDLENPGPVPKHLSHKISEEAWKYIYNKAYQLIESNALTEACYYKLNDWQVRSWFISYLMNPCAENKKDVIHFLHKEFKLVNNLELLETLNELDSLLITEHSA